MGMLVLRMAREEGSSRNVIHRMATITIVTTTINETIVINIKQ